MRRHSPVLALACEVAPERMPRGAAFIGYCQDESCTLSQWHDISCNAELSCVCQEGGQVWGVSERMNQIHDDLKAEGGSYREGLECEDGVWRDDGDDGDAWKDGSWAVGLIGPIIGLTCTILWCVVGAAGENVESGVGVLGPGVEGHVGGGEQQHPRHALPLPQPSKIEFRGQRSTAVQQENDRTEQGP